MQENHKIQYCFQNCQKLVVFSRDGRSVLLARRKGEADYDRVFSFIGGKMEITDESIIAGIQREKNEEVGGGFKIKLYPVFNSMILFFKKNGSRMVLPHYFAEHVDGQIKLNEEYSEYRWVPLNELNSFEPKIATIPTIVENLLRLKLSMKTDEFVII